jgi:predicted DNA-binding protein
MRTFKLYMVRARVSRKMKQQLEALASERGEAEAVLIREAIRVYIETHAVTPPDPVDPGASSRS